MVDEPYLKYPQLLLLKIYTLIPVEVVISPVSKIKYLSEN